MQRIIASKPVVDLFEKGDSGDSGESANFNATVRTWGNPLDTATLESIIGRIISASPSHWGRETVIPVVRFADLDPAIIAKAKAEGYDAQGRKANGETVSGVTYDGKVYLVQENISAELECGRRNLALSPLGHGGDCRREVRFKGRGFFPA